MRCFEILGLPDLATAGEVKQAYHRLAEGTHPDKGGDPCEFHKIHLAYKQAMSIAVEPVTCDGCLGTGRAMVSRGFAAIGIICATCGGTGTVERTAVQQNKKEALDERHLRSP